MESLHDVEVRYDAGKDMMDIKTIVRLRHMNYERGRRTRTPCSSQSRGTLKQGRRFTHKRKHRLILPRPTRVVTCQEDTERAARSKIGIYVTLLACLSTTPVRHNKLQEELRTFS